MPDGGSIDVGGFNPWNAEWHTVDEPQITVAHPQYRSQHHLITVYEFRSADKVQRFAAGELSNGAWGFFVPKRTSLFSKVAERLSR